MLLAGYKGVKVSNFGGLNTLLGATNCPPFMSPDCQDVEFLPQTVKSRPPTRNILNGGGLATSVNYVKTFVMPNGNVRTLWMDSLGNFFYEDVTHNEGVSNLIAQTVHGDSFPNSVTMFGKEWIAIGDGIKGTGIPRWYDGTTFGRVSQDGPGGGDGGMIPVDNVSVLNTTGGVGLVEAPAMAIISTSEIDDIVTVQVTWFSALLLATAPGDSIRVAGAPAGYNGDFTILTISRLSPASLTVIITYQNPTTGLAPGGAVGTVSCQATKVTTTSPHGFPIVPGDDVMSPAPRVTIALAPVGAYNGTWEVRNTPSANEMWVQIGSFNQAASGAPATVTIIGDIVAGRHQVVVMFETADGYITQPSPIASWEADGNKRVKVADIPIGPPNVIARILAFTPVDSGDFYWIPPESATAAVPTTRIPDNTTTTAIFNFSDDDLLNGSPANDFFDLITLPPVASFAEYKSRLVAVGALNPVDNFANLSFDGGYRVDLLSVPLGWNPGVNYNNNAPGKTTDSVFGFAYQMTGNIFGTTVGEIKQPATLDSLGLPILTAGKGYTITAYFKKSAVMGGVTAKVHLRSLSAGYDEGITANVGSQVFISQYVQLTADLPPLPTPLPSDLELYIQMENAAVGDSVFVDDVQLLPTDNPTQNSTALVSYAEEPESFNGITGILQPAEENGQRLTAPFTIRDFLYLSKERSLFVTQDNGTTEPDEWEINEVSQKVGTPSFRGVGIGDEWAIVAGETGAWFFTGGILADENKLTNEIQPTWFGINWLKGYLLDVKVDTKRKRAYINVPTGNSTFNNRVFTVDYTEGWGDATNNGGTGRKWAPWNIGANSQNLLLRFSNTMEMCFGGNLGNTNIFQLDATLTVNNSLDAYWESGYFEGTERLNFGYLTANVVGGGLMELTLRRGDQTWYRPIRGWNMKRIIYTNMERTIQQQGYRMAIKFGTSDLLDYFALQDLTVYVREADYAPVRGINA